MHDEILYLRNSESCLPDFLFGSAEKTFCGVFPFCNETQKQVLG